MNEVETALSEPGRAEVLTACGGKITLEAATPRAIYQGKVIYFCLKECKAAFDDDPLHSCLEETIRAKDE